MPLNPVERGEQLERYRHSLHNLILTDYLEFRWYVEGELVETATLGKLDRQDTIKRTQTGIAEVANLLTRFFAHTIARIGRAEELAKRMAHLARMMHDAILATYQQEGAGGPFHGQLQEFQDALIPQLEVDEFADMYAQTLTYGLFAARVETPAGVRFDRFNANRYLPQTNPFLRNFFYNIAGPDLPDTVAWLVDDLAHLLDCADMSEILRDFGKRTRQEDPIIHFYETFLHEYDPALRQQRGVYYTPEPVVSYIVRSIDHILQTHFNRPLGLADRDTLILDPATGTATFLYFVIQHIYEKLREMGQAGAWDEYVSHHLLPRLFGFELLMAPYAMAHLKLGMQLRQYGYRFNSRERLGIYLTNALDPAVKDAPPMGFAGMISAEGKAAARVKQDVPIMVILGNPPYAVSSANNGKYINRLMDSYKKAVRSERNIQPLADDYIKFIRFAHDRIERTGHGIVGMITNHAYLAGLIHRGMREELINTFSQIYVLDLHGNATIGEVTPEGEPDQNVFDIRQGVAILFLVKHPHHNSKATVYHSELWGKREAKYKLLQDGDFESSSWVTLSPSSPHYFFVPKDFELREEYEKGWSVDKAFPLNSGGIKTHRDHFALGFTRSELGTRLIRFRDLSITDAAIANDYYLNDTRDWKLSTARKDIQTFEDWESKFALCCYRPFDTREIYFSNSVVELPRHEVMDHLLHPNVALLTMRRIRSGEYEHFFVANSTVGKDAVSIKDACSVFPLYFYTTPKQTALTLFALTETIREPNLASSFTQTISEKLGLSFTYDPGEQPIAPPSPAGAPTFIPEDIFYYAYAIFHSPTYRTRYAEFLKIDFPRLPLTGDVALFRKLAQLGYELASLHLLQSPKLHPLRTRFPIAGSNEVTKPRYVPSPSQTSDFSEKSDVSNAAGQSIAGRVYINNSQYFEGISPAVWEFQIGGYQVLDKWLKDRKGRPLSFDDILHYQRVVIALAETMTLMAQVDETIPGWPIE